MRFAALLGFLLLAACSTRSGGDDPPADAGLGGSGGSGGGGGVAGTQSFPLPAELDLGGDASAIAVGDVDADGYLDLALLVLAGGGAKLVVAWGAASAPFAERSEQPLAGSAVAESLGTSESVVVLADVSADGAVDVVTASGVWRALGPRSFEWRPFGDEALQALSPVAVIDLGTGNEVVRGSIFGNVEACIDQSCAPLPGQPAPCANPTDCPITDLVARDFDGDGHLDVLAGRQTPPTWLWASWGGFDSPTAVAGLSAVDFQAGDIDRDGVPDVVAKSASVTTLWLASPGGVAPFFSTQSIEAAHASPGGGALADANSDGCLDLMQVSAANADVAVRLGSSEGQGCAETIGAHDPAATSDVGWTIVPGLFGAVGIQQLDVNGDQVPEWVVRTGSQAPSLHFVSIPAL